MRYVSDINSALEATLDAALEMLNAEMGKIQILDPATQELRIAAFRGFGEEFLDHFRRVTQASDTACGRALAQLQRVVIEDITLEPSYEPYLEEAEQIGYRSVQSTPLLNRSGELLGILSTHFRQPHRPSDVQLRMLSLYAQQAVDAMEAGRIAKAAMRSEAMLRFLDRLNEMTRDLEDPREIMTTTSEQLAAVLDADRCQYVQVLPCGVLLLVNNEWSGVPETGGKKLSLAQLSSVSLTTLQSGRPWVVNDAPRERIQADIDAGFLMPETGAYIVCPVVKAGQLVGMLAVQHAGPRVWCSDEISLIQQVADRSWSHIERGRVARELRESELRHRTFLTTIPDVIWVTDALGRMSESQGESWSHFTGQSASEYEGRGWLNAVHPDDRDLVIQQWRSCLERKCSFSAEFRLRRHDGQFRHLSARSAPVLDSQGEVQEWVGICDDVHVQYLSEARNRFLIALDDGVRSEIDPHEMTRTAVRQLGQFLGATRCGYADVDFDAGTFYISSDFTIGGHSIVGKYRLDELGIAFEQCLISGTIFLSNDIAKDDRCTSVVGTYRRLEIGAIICIPLHKEGQLAALMMVHQSTPRVWEREEVEMVQQVTTRCWESIERSHMTRELRQNEYRLRLAQRAGRIGSFEWLIPENHFLWSDELCGLFGLRPVAQQTDFDEWLGHCVPEDAVKLTEQIESCLATSEVELSYEFRACLPSGDHRWLRGQAIFLYDSLGMPKKMIGVNIDIDMQKRATDALRDADRLKDEFLATLAHELRNPLAPIRNAIEMLQLGGNDPNAVKEYQEAINRQVIQMVRLVDDLLDVSRITRGKLELRRSLVSLGEILHSAIETTRPAIDAAGHQLFASFPKTPVWLNADQTRLAQVFSNLLNNAAKYSERNREIEVWVDQTDETVTVHVSDRGIGIPPQMIDLIFEPFMQVDRSITRSQGGLGIGLTLVKRLVELHGGKVSVRSGEKTTFSVELPIVKLATAPPVPRPVREGPRRLERHRVLVVDDTPAALYMISKLLEKIGQTVYKASSAQEALDVAREVQPDVVISDIGMPDIDGYQLAMLIRNEPQLQGIRLVALTGYGQESDRVKAFAAGFDHHLVKPVGLTDLTTLLSLPEQSYSQ